MLDNEGSEARGREIKSRRAKELEELRSRGVAKSRREKLLNCELLYPIITKQLLLNF